MSVNKRLREVLESLNISQEQIAFKTGVSRQTINNSVNGKYSPKSDVIEKILLAYPEIDPDYLMTGRKQIHSSVSTNGNKNSYGTIQMGDNNQVNEKEANYKNIIEAMKDEINALKQVIEAKNELIEALKK